MYSYMCLRIHTLHVPEIYIKDVYMCIYTYVYLRIHIHIYTHICVFAYMPCTYQKCVCTVKHELLWMSTLENFIMDTTLQIQLILLIAYLCSILLTHFRLAVHTHTFYVHVGEFPKAYYLYERLSRRKRMLVVGQPYIGAVWNLSLVRDFPEQMPFL
jgi:hypothetical protein